MRAWKIALLGAALVPAFFTVAYPASNGAEHARGAALAASGTELRQKVPSEKISNDERSDSEYGWGPFRITDW